MHYNKSQEQSGAKTVSLRTICREIEADYRRESGKLIILSHTTLAALVKGCVLKSQSNAARSWVSDREAHEIIGFVVKAADWGHGLDIQCLKEHADEILQAQMPGFPSVSKD